MEKEEESTKRKDRRSQVAEPPSILLRSRSQWVETHSTVTNVNCRRVAAHVKTKRPASDSNRDQLLRNGSTLSFELAGRTVILTIHQNKVEHHPAFLPMRVPKREFVEVLLEVLSADVMEDAYYSTFEECPCAFDCVGMDLFSCPFTGMSDVLVTHGEAEVAVLLGGVGIDGAYCVNVLHGNSLDTEGLEILNGDHLESAATLCHSNDLLVGGAWTVSFGRSDHSVVNFDDATELVCEDFVLHCLSDSLGHVPGSFVADTEFSFELLSGNTLGRVAHEPDCDEPTGQFDLGAMEDRLRGDTKLIPAGFAVPASVLGHPYRVFGSTSWTFNPVWPAKTLEVLPTFVDGGEFFPGGFERANLRYFLHGDYLLQDYYSTTLLLSQADKGPNHPSLLKAEPDARGYTHRTSPRCRCQACTEKTRLVPTDCCVKWLEPDLLLSRSEFANMVTGFI